MANTDVTTRDTQLEKQRLGYMELSLTNFANTSEPNIAGGSVVEVGGTLYSFTSDESISGWSSIPNDTDAYIKLVPGSGQVTAEFTTTAPTWSAAKQGWYAGADRYIGGLHRGATSADYEGKWLYQQSQANNDTHRFRGNGTAEFDKVDTGQGSNELYPMDQAVRSTDAVTFASVDTGQGSNELYPMDQGVRTVDKVRFQQVRREAILVVNGTDITGNVAFDAIYAAIGSPSEDLIRIPLQGFGDYDGGGTEYFYSLEYKHSNSSFRAIDHAGNVPFVIANGDAGNFSELIVVML